MEDYQQRALDEKKELDERRIKLHMFIDKGLFGLSVKHQKLLERQGEVMTEYSIILGERIAMF